MNMLYLPILAVVVLSVLCFRRERDLRPARHPYARTVYAAALVVLAFYALLWFAFGFGEIFGGDVSGWIHLVPALCVAVLWAFAHRRPFESGIVLTALGVIQAVILILTTDTGLAFWGGAVLLTALPFGVVGLLLLAANRMAGTPS